MQQAGQTGGCTALSYVCPYSDVLISYSHPPACETVTTLSSQLMTLLWHYWSERQETPKNPSKAGVGGGDGLIWRRRRAGEEMIRLNNASAAEAESVWATEAGVNCEAGEETSSATDRRTDGRTDEAAACH